MLYHPFSVSKRRRHKLSKLLVASLYMLKANPPWSELAFCLYCLMTEIGFLHEPLEVCLNLADKGRFGHGTNKLLDHLATLKEN